MQGCAASSSNIAARLSHWADERPLAPALIDGSRAISFGALDDECARLGAGLTSVGIKAGARVALMVPPSLELFALAFALFRIGAVPVLVDPGVGWKHLRYCLGRAKPSYFIGSPKAHLGRVLGGWARETLRQTIVAQGFFPGAIGLGALRRGASMLRAVQSPQPGATAAILFTSGSTGAPKGAVYTHEMLGAQLESLAALFGCEAGEVSVATFPLFGLFDLALGMSVVLPRMDATRPGSVDARQILGPIERHGAAQLFGSPALLEQLVRHGKPIASLKRVLSAGAPVPAKLVAKLLPLLPKGCALYTPYGATEALPVACITGEELLTTAEATARGEGVCVGKPAPAVEVRIVDEEIRVRGPVVSPAYFDDAEATAEAKSDGWHRMGDLGRIDDRGRLWYLGRKTQRVGAHLTACVEGRLDALPEVRRSALVGVAGEPVVVVELERGAAATPELRARLSKLSPSGVVLLHPSLPVDRRHNAKIQREALAVWAAKELKGKLA